MQDFKHLKIWQRAHALSIAIHKETRHFSDYEAASLRSQLKRAVSGIAAAIVEGCGAATNKEFARYLDIAIKGANETEQHLLEARDFDLLPMETWHQWSSEVIEIRKMTFGYRAQVLKSGRHSDQKKLQAPAPIPAEPPADAATLLPGTPPNPPPPHA